MKRLRTGGLIAVVCVVGMGIVLGARSGGGDAAAGSAHGRAAQQGTPTNAVPAAISANADPAAAATPLPEMPEHVKFRFLFEHLGTLKDKPAMLRRYQEKLGLPDAAFSVLLQLAVEHEQQASIIDKQAQIIVDNIHAQYPRRLPPGVAPPKEPQELLDLYAQRDALALTFRDRVRGQLGDETYARFKQSIDEEFRQKLPTRFTTPPKLPVTTQKENK